MSDTIVAFWNGITEPQATILAAILTVIGAVVGIAVGASFFSGRVKDLRGALDESKGLIARHSSDVERLLSDVGERLVGQLSSLSANINKLRADVDELQSRSSTQGTTEAQSRERDRLKEAWTKIRDRIEAIAADPSIDGRTRAKYERIDRRNYSDVVEILRRDGALNQHGSDYQRASAIWQKYKSGRTIPTELDITEIQRIADLLIDRRAVPNDTSPGGPQ